jgi:hypothetical protein
MKPSKFMMFPYSFSLCVGEVMQDALKECLAQLPFHLSIFFKFCFWSLLCKELTT